MSITQSNAAKGIEPVAYPAFAGHVVAQRFKITIPAAAALNDIFELACLNANCRVIDMILDSDDLDSAGPSITLDVGIMSGDWGDTSQSRTCGSEFFAASTAAQAGTVVRPTAKGAFRVAPTDKARSIGVKIAAAAATGVAGEVGLTVYQVAL